MGVSTPIKLRQSTKKELNEVGRYLMKTAKFKKLSYDEIINILLIDFRQRRNRGGVRSWRGKLK